MRKLGQNLDGYVGERISIQDVLLDLRRIASAAKWHVMELFLPGESPLITLHRSPALPQRHIYISAGIHGDEPAGPLTLRRLLQEDKWPADAALYCCPCLNPGGFTENRRENHAGKDLNRDYRQPLTPAVRAHTAWLRAQPPFDLALCLHEDWEAQGFYLYELNADAAPSLAEEIIRRVRSVCPVDVSPTIEGRAATEGVIRAAMESMDRPDWPESFFLIEHKTRLTYTFEAPSDFPMATRIEALRVAVRAALKLEG